MLRFQRFEYATALAALLWLESWAGPAPAGVYEWTTQGPYGGDVSAVLVDPSQPATLFVGTRGGSVFKSTDGAMSWSLVFAGALRIGSIETLVMDPQEPMTLYVSGMRGVFKSTDGAATWAPAGTGLGAGSGMNYILSFAFDPTTSSTLYAASVDGLFRSLDGAGSWQRIADFGGTLVSSVAVDPQRPSTLYAATGTGVFRSTDEGSTWAIAGNADVPFMRRVVVDPTDSSVLYAITLFSGGGIYKSLDGGEQWALLPFPTGGEPRALLLDPADAQILYVATRFEGGVYRSLDGGASWTEISQGLVGPQVYALAIDPRATGFLYAGTGFDNGVVRSVDGGLSWTHANAGLAATLVLDVEIDPENPQTLYASSRRGIFKSVDRGVSWAITNSGLLRERFWALAVDPRTPETVYAGSAGFHFETGVFKTKDGGAHWSISPGAFLGGAWVTSLEVDPVTPRTVWAASTEGMFRSLDGGASWAELGEGLREQAIEVAIDPMTPTTLYAISREQGFSNDLSKSTNGGLSWETVSDSFPDVTWRGLAIDPHEPKTVYTTGSPGGVYKTRDGGRTWIDTGSPDGFVSTVAVDPRNPSNVYAAGSNVYRSVDGGASWSTLGDILVDGVAKLAIDPRRTNRLYASTRSGGVFELDLRCEPDASTLCIDDQAGDQRFEITAEFNTEVGGGASGSAQAIALASQGIDRGGILWFFDPTNPEILVKVLDGCGVNDRFWVFFAAATDVGFELTVKDHLTGAEKSYSHPDGTAAVPVTDTDAFATCPLGGEESASPVTPATRSSMSDSATSDETTACSSDATTLCLDGEPGDRRFKVSLSYASQLGGGLAGEAGAISLAPLGIDRGGILWFFDPSNPEVLIKVLDGCGVNDRFWVFTAASTNVGFTVAVEDTSAGVRRVYNSPDLQASVPITDTDAFATCSF